jgi:hypothetical protein
MVDDYSYLFFFLVIDYLVLKERQYISPSEGFILIIPRYINYISKLRGSTLKLSLDHQCMVSCWFLVMVS